MASKKSRRKQKVKVRFQFLFSLSLILGGLALIFWAATSGLNMSLKAQPQKVIQIEANPQFSKIESINIPKIKRNLIVEEGSFVDGRWEVSPEGVSFYSESNLPEEGGNTVLYGHNKARILGGLIDMKEGDKIELTLVSGGVLEYEVVETRVIKPDEVSILNETEDDRLTIYTCTGFLDSARFVVVAKPIL